MGGRVPTFPERMERRELGPGGPEITPVGIGTAPIGSAPGWWVRWGPQDEGDAIRAVHAALDAGVNWVDTTPFYGWGRAEELLGRALAGRDDVLVFTKCGTFRRPDGDDYMDLRPASIRRDLEGSLRRLGRDHVDLLQPHDPDPSVPIEETWAEVLRLVDEGKVRFGGLSNHPPGLVERALAAGPVCSLQHQYSLLARQAESTVLPFARARGLGVLAWSPLASGFLVDGFDPAALPADDFRRTHPFARLPHLERLRGALRTVADAHGTTTAAVAVARLLAEPGLTAAIVGVRDGREGAEIGAGVGVALSPAELAALDAAA